MDVRWRTATVARAALLAVALGVWCVRTAAAQEPRDTADAARLIEVLDLRAGSAVADVGAGSGRLTVPVARHVGPKGVVYSTDINPARLSELRRLARRLDNVEVVEGAPARTNLPDACCDAIFMRNVYHHFGDPAGMNASLYRSLRPGGTLAVVDFPPETGRTAPPGRRADGGAHGVTPVTVIEELSAAGFVDVERLEWPSRGSFLVVARRGD